LEGGREHREVATALPRELAKGEFVDGVQLGIVTRGEFRILTEDKLAPLRKLSNEIDTSILTTLLAPSVSSIAL
jgi:hypothetical protein